MYPQSRSVRCQSGPNIGMSRVPKVLHHGGEPPASNSRTVKPFSANRPARVDPAEPPPTGNNFFFFCHP